MDFCWLSHFFFLFCLICFCVRRVCAGFDLTPLKRCAIVKFDVIWSTTDSEAVGERNAYWTNTHKSRFQLTLPMVPCKQNAHKRTALFQASVIGHASGCVTQRLSRKIIYSVRTACIETKACVSHSNIPKLEGSRRSPPRIWFAPIQALHTTPHSIIVCCVSQMEQLRSQCFFEFIPGQLIHHYIVARTSSVTGAVAVLSIASRSCSDVMVLPSSSMDEWMDVFQYEWNAACVEMPLQIVMEVKHLQPHTQTRATPVQASWMASELCAIFHSITYIFQLPTHSVSSMRQLTRRIWWNQIQFIIKHREWLLCTIFVLLTNIIVFSCCWMKHLNQTVGH